jgi:hypothetical protein
MADTLGLGFMLLVLLDTLRPSLLLLPTVTAGGDTPCHYPTFVWFYEHLLPHGRLHGWYPGAYLGQPLLLYYFPLPFLAMSVMAPVVGLPAAFKLGTVLGVFLLPLLTYTALRLMGFGFPAPLLGAAASLVFLFCEENPIWGGTIASTLAGEFAYMLGLGLAVLFLGVAYRAYSRGWSWRWPGLLLAVTGLAHGYVCSRRGDGRRPTTTRGSRSRPRTCSRRCCGRCSRWPPWAGRRHSSRAGARAAPTNVCCSSSMPPPPAPPSPPPPPRWG